MPRFHFHILNDKNERDWAGTELADLTSARDQAVRFAADLLRDDPTAFFDQRVWSMRVTDHLDTTLFELTFTARRYLEDRARTGDALDGEKHALRGG